MMILNEIKNSFLHLLFPHLCAGCGSDNISSSNVLCLRCLSALPETNFELHQNNPLEKKFWGRLPLTAAAAHFYFTRESLTQQLIHRFKYQGNKELGLQLGKMMGLSLKQSYRFRPDALVPLPLYPAREHRRGFNQSEVLCRGIQEELGVPVLNNAVARPHHTETQTRKGRIERWKNIEGKFIIREPSSIAGKHLLLIDDVITTGATLESCGTELLKIENTRLSVACLCYAAR